MARKNNKSNAVRYTAYKNSGRKLINKEKKQKRHEKRMARFAARKEAGKSYVYKKGEPKQCEPTWDTRGDGKPDTRLSIQKLDSVFRNLEDSVKIRRIAAAEARKRAAKDGIVNNDC